MGPRRHFTYSNVMSTLAVFLVVAGGTATALTGSNTVFSDDITNGEVKTPDVATNAITTGKIRAGNVTAGDLGPNAVGGAEVVDGSLNSIDVNDNSLTSDDVFTDTLTGADLNESTLGQVPSALAASLGGTGRSTGGAGCDPESGTFITCAAVTINLAAPSRVLVIGRIRALTEVGASNGHGSCRVGTSVTGGIAGSQSPLETGQHDESDVEESAAFLGISPAIGPGTVSFGIDCNQDLSSGAIRFDNAGVAAIALSAN